MNIIRKLNKELIKNILIISNNNITENIDKNNINDTRILKEYNKISKIKEDSINRIRKIRLSKSNIEYNYSNRIYK